MAKPNLTPANATTVADHGEHRPSTGTFLRAAALAFAGLLAGNADGLNSAYAKPQDPKPTGPSKVEPAPKLKDPPSLFSNKPLSKMTAEDKVAEAAHFKKLVNFITRAFDGELLDEQRKALDRVYYPKPELTPRDRQFLQMVVSGMDVMDPKSARADTLLSQARTKGEQILVEHVKRYLSEEFIVDKDGVKNDGLTFFFKLAKGDEIKVTYDKDLQIEKLVYKGTTFTLPKDAKAMSAAYIPRDALSSMLCRCAVDLNSKTLGAVIKVNGLSGSHADISVGEGEKQKRYWLLDAKLHTVTGNAVSEKDAKEAAKVRKGLFDLYVESTKLRAEALKLAPKLFLECEGLAPKFTLDGAPSDVSPVGPCFTIGVIKGRKIDAKVMELFQKIAQNNQDQGLAELRLIQLGALSDFEGRVKLTSVRDQKVTLIAASNGAMVTTVQMDGEKPGAITFQPTPGQTHIRESVAALTTLPPVDAIYTVRSLGLQKAMFDVMNDDKEDSETRAKAAVIVAGLMNEAPIVTFPWICKDIERTAKDLGKLLAKSPTLEIALALGFLGQPAEKVAAELIKHKDPKVREMAVSVVSISGSSTGREEPRKILQEATKDSDMYVAFRAGASLRIAGAPIAAEPVVKYLKHLAGQREMLPDVDALSLTFGLGLNDFSKMKEVYELLLQTTPKNVLEFPVSELANHPDSNAKLFLIKWIQENPNTDFELQQNSLLTIGDSLATQPKAVAVEMIHFRTRAYLAKDYVRMQVAEESLNKLLAIDPKLHAEAIEAATGKDGVAVLKDATMRLEGYRTKHGISCPSRLLPGLDLEAYVKMDKAPAKDQLVVEILTDVANRNGAGRDMGEKIAMYQKMGFHVRYAEFSSPEQFAKLDSQVIKDADGKEVKVHLKVIFSHASTFGFGSGYEGNKAGTKSQVTVEDLRDFGKKYKTNLAKGGYVIFCGCSSGEGTGNVVDVLRESMYKEAAKNGIHGPRADTSGYTPKLDEKMKLLEVEWGDFGSPVLDYQAYLHLRDYGTGVSAG